eukprot:175226-Hanusia_phi.AAC.1
MSTGGGGGGGRGGGGRGERGGEGGGEGHFAVQGELVFLLLHLSRSLKMLLDHLHAAVIQPAASAAPAAHRCRDPPP